MWCLQLRFEEVGWSNRVRLDPGSDDAVPKPAEKPPAVATSRTPSEARSICRSSTSSTSMLKVFENRKRRRCKYRQPSLALPKTPKSNPPATPNTKTRFCRGPTASRAVSSPLRLRAWMYSVFTSERSGTNSILLSRSSSWSFSEMPRTGPRRDSERGPTRKPCGVGAKVGSKWAKIQTNRFG